jgi:hypothetical protein
MAFNNENQINLCQIISIQIRDKMNTLCHNLKILKTVCVLNKRLEEKLHYFKESSETRECLNKEKFIKCDGFELCKTFLREQIGYKTNNKINEMLIKCVWSQCIIQTKYRSDLKKHLLTHSEEKKYKCHYKRYHKLFKDSIDLKRHKLIYSGVNKY